MQTLNQEEKDFLLKTIRNVEDFPKPGIQFKDITTLLNNSEAFELLMNHLEHRYKDKDIDFIAGIESRGFIFAAALATRLKSRFVPIRKPGKLPYTTVNEKYSLEYGVDEIQIHIDAFNCEKHKANVLLIDDLIATGGTAKASVNLINKCRAFCLEACFVIDLKNLGGSKEVRALTKVYSVLEIED